MYQSTSLHLATGEHSSVELQDLMVHTPAKQYFTVTLGGNVYYIFGETDQLLNLATQFEQAARAWQMARDGVSAEDQSHVFDYENDRVSLVRE